MKITRLETIWFDPLPAAEWERHRGTSRQTQPNNLWLQIHTDEGLMGLGETYYSPRAVSAIIHDVYAPLLIGRDAIDIDNHWNNMFSLVNFCGHAGAEMRALSVVDVALWDIAGQHAGQPIYNLLGGRNRERIGVYNTCVSYGSYHDYQAWMEGRAGELAQQLLEQGIRAMKVWPFDQFGTTLAGPANPYTPVTMWGGQTAAGTLSHRISNEDLKSGLKIVEDIRNTVGDRMEIAIEGHARWNLPTSVRIAHALEPFDIMWLEEIMPPDNVESFLRLKQATNIPLCQSERLLSRFAFREYIEKGATDIVMPDLSWCGGITEARRIGSLADTYYLPVTLHDTIGPVALRAAAHMMLHIPNAMIQEVVRSYLDGWYHDVVTNPVEVRDGFLTLDASPGLGTTLRPDLHERPDVRIESTDESRLRRW
jgi:L-alanine-DL-glutamate epimerase-like enolase superfamily enzyme